MSGEPGLRKAADERLRRRKHILPHWQMGGSTYFITFRSARGRLPEEALAITRDRILQEHGNRCEILFGVLMPDHAHLLLYPRRCGPDAWHDLSAIMQGIKGGSAFLINKRLETTGSVWQKESFDRIVRDESELHEKWFYIYDNPRRAGLVEDPDDYPFFVRGRSEIE